VPDELADPRPRHTAEVEQGDASVAKVVRRERRHARRRARSCHSTQALARDVLEDSAIGMAVVAWAEIEDGSEEKGRRRGRR
jgi:hypothetical protein